MNDDKLVKDIKALPDAVPAKDAWSKINMAIEMDAKLMQLEQQEMLQPLAEPPKKSWIPKFAAYACGFALVVTASWLMRDYVEVKEPDFASDKPMLAAVSDSSDTLFNKNIQSLQQGNSLYYQKLGYQLQHFGASLEPQTQSALKNLRQANKAYITALQKSPNDFELQAKILKTFQKERKLLQRIIA